MLTELFKLHHEMTPSQSLRVDMETEVQAGKLIKKNSKINNEFPI